MARPIQFELRCSAFLPLSEMAEAFEAAMDLIGDYEPTKDQIARRWQEAAEELSQNFAPIHRAPGPGPTTRPVERNVVTMAPEQAAEWSRRVAKCLADAPVQGLLHQAMKTTSAYRIAVLAFAGGAPESYVWEFLRRAVQEAVDR